MVKVRNTRSTLQSNKIIKKHIQINGQRSGIFEFNKEFNPGNSLSPLLFIDAMDRLNTKGKTEKMLFVYGMRTSNMAKKINLKRPVF